MKTDKARSARRSEKIDQHRPLVAPPKPRMSPAKVSAWMDEFKFDYNEDAEPCSEIHRMRIAMRRHFKTDEAYYDYVARTPSAEDLLAELSRRAAAERKLEAQTVKRTAKTVAPRRHRKAALAPA